MPASATAHGAACEAGAVVSFRPRQPCVKHGVEFVIADLAVERRRVNLSTLPPARKQQYWQLIQDRYPDMAELMRSAHFKALLKHFDSSVMIHGID